MRGNFSQKFLTELSNGKLRDVIKYILDDTEMDVQVRDNYLNIYYKGGNILRIKPQTFFFDKFYFYLGHPNGYPKSHIEKVASGKEKEINHRTTRPIPSKSEAMDIVSNLDMMSNKLIQYLPENPEKFFSQAKSVMDSWFGIWSHQERHDQQEISTTNRSADSNSDLAVIDIEYARAVTLVACEVVKAVPSLQLADCEPHNQIEDCYMSMTFRSCSKML